MGMTVIGSGESFSWTRIDGLGRTGWWEEVRVPGGVSFDRGDEEDRTIDAHRCGAERCMSILDSMTGVLDRRYTMTRRMG